MVETDKKLFAEILRDTHSLYGKNVSSGLLAIWWNALNRYELSDVRHAISLHVQNPDSGQFVPKPADVVRQLDGGTETQALQAWSKVEKAIRSIGQYQSVVFDDPAIHRVIYEMGGWIELCKITNEELPFRAREFEKRYRAYAGKPLKEYPRQLTGLAEAHNSSNGHQVKPPVLIGNRETALLVYQTGGSSLQTYTALPAAQHVTKALTMGKA